MVFWNQPASKLSIWASEASLARTRELVSLAQIGELARRLSWTSPRASSPFGGVARIHVRAARERRPECERRARGAGARSSPSRLASLNLNGELASRPSWPDIFRRPVVILSPLFCCYPYKIYGKRRELDSLEQITPQSEKSPQWPLCTITSDKQILPPRLVCVLNSLHPPSFCMGILFECTALGINLYKTSRIYNVKTRLCSTDNAFRLFPSETLKTSRCFLLPNRITLRW